MLLLGHSVYRGQISLGTYMQICAAYAKVDSGLSMLIHRWVEFNTLLSVVRRLRELDRALPPRAESEASDPRRHLLAAAAVPPASERSPLVGVKPGGGRPEWLQGLLDLVAVEDR